jgi:hypothetical protein
VSGVLIRAELRHRVVPLVSASNIVDQEAE